LSSLRRLLPLVTLAVAIAAFYLYNLDGVGVLLKDEPRYAAIGRAMAHTGDFVTPRLWGAPWFEKPPLLYWMTAAGTLAGLNPELSARLPVALLSLAFLAASFFLLWREFGAQAAAVSIALLASCAGWITYSQLCLTDLPLAVWFSLAVFLALPLLPYGSRANRQPLHVPLRFLAIGASIGLARVRNSCLALVLGRLSPQRLPVPARILSEAPFRAPLLAVPAACTTLVFLPPSAARGTFSLDATPGACRASLGEMGPTQNLPRRHLRFRICVLQRVAE
jgi:4-amino-4-deoxy-L-arabinose transferase-like glycosyltransferase